MSDSIKDTEARIAAMAAERELMRKELRDQNTARTPEIATLRARITALEAERDALREGLRDLRTDLREHAERHEELWRYFYERTRALLKEPRND